MLLSCSNRVDRRPGQPALTSAAEDLWVAVLSRGSQNLPIFFPSRMYERERERERERSIYCRYAVKNSSILDERTWLVFLRGGVGCLLICFHVSFIWIYTSACLVFLACRPPCLAAYTKRTVGRLKSKGVPRSSERVGTAILAAARGWKGTGGYYKDAIKCCVGSEITR